MEANKRKERLFAFSSIVCDQAGGSFQTRRARRISPRTALERLENVDPSAVDVHLGQQPCHSSTEIFRLIAYGQKTVAHVVVPGA